MLTSTSGPVPSHSSLYSPGEIVVPFTLVGWCKLRLAFVAAKALEANRRATPMIRVFETVANFIAAPFSFPKLRREAVGAARFATSARKRLSFPANRLQFFRRG